MIKYDPYVVLEAIELEAMNHSQEIEQGDAPLFLEALEREARRAEHEGLMICGDDEWARR